MANASYPMRAAERTPEPGPQRCGARTRAGTPCRGLAIMPAGRCRMHGGKSLSGPAHGRFRTGLYTREMLAERREQAELLRRTRDLIRQVRARGVPLSPRVRQMADRLDALPLDDTPELRAS